MRPLHVRVLCLGVLLGAAVLAAACGPKVEERVLHRSNCLVCHTPLDDEGVAHGIEDAHPWAPLTCVQCHGGNDRLCDGELTEVDGEPQCDGQWSYDQEAAHVSPGDGPRYIKNLSSRELDELDPAYVQFINPGDFRVLDNTCKPCHAKESDIVQRSTRAHTSGEVTVARDRAGRQDHPHALVGAVDLVDPDFPGDEDPCAAPELEMFDPPPLGYDGTVASIPTVAEAQDQYMVKSCFRCHLNDFGENQFRGDLRSSGCTACHMPYSDDGFSESEDPRINKGTIPHPVKHEMTKSPDIETCTHCHYRGGRIGIGYQGYRESAGKGLNPESPLVLGEILHGHDGNYYLVDEDPTNSYDETPPDVHFAAGMHCVDCHGVEDVHGDGHIYADTQCAVRTHCSDCHGTVRERASLDPARDNVYEVDGELWLRGKVTGVELRMPQIADAVNPTSPRYSYLADAAMGIDDNGFSHTDTVECYTCHAGWLPSCYGCHVEIDVGKNADYHTTGVSQPGKASGSRRWVVLNDLVLMKNTEGMIAPSMPAERFFMTITDNDEVLRSEPRTFVTPEGRKMAGFGQRAFNPHTTQRLSPFTFCDRCHTVGDPAAPDNAVLLDVSYGFGTQRFPHKACDVSNEDPSCDPETDYITYWLDAIQTREGEPLVVVGHPDPMESRPLNLEEIDRMRQVIVPEEWPYRTEIPDDAATNVNWPSYPAL